MKSGIVCICGHDKQKHLPHVSCCTIGCLCEFFEEDFSRRRLTLFEWMALIAITFCLLTIIFPLPHKP